MILPEGMSDFQYQLQVGTPVVQPTAVVQVKVGQKFVRRAACGVNGLHASILAFKLVIGRELNSHEIRDLCQEIADQLGEVRVKMTDADGSLVVRTVKMNIVFKEDEPIEN